MENKIAQKLRKEENKIAFYVDKQRGIELEVILQKGDVWINSEDLAQLFGIDRTGITRHIKNIYEEEELPQKSTCAKFAHIGNNRKRQYYTNYYNLDMMIAIGLRVHSEIAVKFRMWANQVMKESMVKSLSKRLPVWTRCWYYIKNKIKVWLKK